MGSIFSYIENHGGSSSRAPTQHHFLFLLGTDTKFTPNPTIVTKDYERGETLSYAAQAIVSLLKEEEQSTRDETSPLAYSSPSVDLLEGPSTFGTEVGERIAQALFLALRTAAQGKKTLQIMGHSRGAAESILVIQELSRIKRTLEEHPDKTLYQILQETPCEMTRTALQHFFTNERETIAARKTLLSNLKQLQINPFLLDPVPGGRWFGLPGVAWRDERFYQPLDCGNNVLLLCRDERTRCFIPIVPSGMLVILIPGHHGTASGNRYNQRLEGDRDAPTTGAQDLTLYKLFQFLHENTDVFGEESARNLNTENKALDPVLQAYLSVDIRRRNQPLLKAYEIVHENDAIYRAFTNDGYPLLMQEDNDGYRYIHLYEHNYESMARFDDRNRHFINQEHAKLYLGNDIHGIDASSSISQHIFVLNCALRNFFEGSDQRLTESIQLHRNKDVFFDSLSILLKSISQKFLCNHVNQEKRTELLQNIQSLFRAINGLKNHLSDSTKKSLLEECEGILQNCIVETINTHWHSITQRIAKLQTQIQYVLFEPEAIHAMDTAYCEAVRAKLPDGIDDIPPGLEAPSMDSIKERLTQLTTNESITEEHKAILFGEDYNALRLLFEANEYTRENYYDNCAELYQVLNELTTAYPDLRKLAPNLPKEMHFQIPIYQNTLITLGTTLPINDREDSEKRTNCDFDQHVQSQARVFHENSPETRMLKNRLEEQGQAFEKLNESIQAIRAESTQRESTIQRLIQYQTTPNQTRCTHTITSKLIPLTNQYRSYLRKQAAKYGVTLPEDNAPLPESSQNPKFKKAYEIIRDQYAAVRELLNDLNNTNIEPNARITAFTNTLHNHDTTLKKHHSPWLAFFKNCSIILAVLFTGIVPGTIAIGAYAGIKNRSPLFFAQSKGDAYAQDCRITIGKMAKKNRAHL